MSSNKICKVELKCKNALMNHVIEELGTNTEITTIDRDNFMVAAEVDVNFAFLAWILQFGNDITILSPEFVKNQIHEIAEKI